MRALLLFVLTGLCLRAEVLDRIAVSVDNGVITEAQVIRQIRLAAFENHEEPNLSGSNKRTAAEQLLERRLIEREMQVNKYGGPDDAQIDAEMKRVEGEYKTPAGFQAALAKYKITQDELREFERAQLAVLRFIELRFRPAIQVSDAEIQDYYQNEFLPDWEKRSKAPAPSLEKVHDQIEHIITRTRESQALDRWLGETRRQSDIRWQQDVFK